VSHKKRVFALARLHSIGRATCSLAISFASEPRPWTSPPAVPNSLLDVGCHLAEAVRIGMRCCDVCALNSISRKISCSFLGKSWYF